MLGRGTAGRPELSATQLSGMRRESDGRNAVSCFSRGSETRDLNV
jgi:hypothetical protein